MNTRVSKIGKIILTSLCVVSFMSVALVAPNAIQIFAGKKRLRLDSVKRAFDKLVYSGCIKVVGNRAYLTNKGRFFLGGESLNGYGKTKKWDNKWTIIIFDISEKKRSSRSKLRITLSNIGFIRLQNSVWVYPYNCDELIGFIKEDFKIGDEVLCLSVDKIENDLPIRKHFKL